jgi:hypothetical protein
MDRKINGNVFFCFKNQDLNKIFDNLKKRSLLIDQNK